MSRPRSPLLELERQIAEAARVVKREMRVERFAELDRLIAKSRAGRPPGARTKHMSRSERIDALAAFIRAKRASLTPRGSQWGTWSGGEWKRRGAR